MENEVDLRKREVVELRKNGHTVEDNRRKGSASSKSNVVHFMDKTLKRIQFNAGFPRNGEESLMMNGPDTRQIPSDQKSNRIPWMT